MRDVDNLRSFFGQYAPELRGTRHGPEIWDLYAAGRLSPETALTGRYQPRPGAVDLSAVLREIEDARREATERDLRRGAAP
jgi:RIO kinase 1